MFSSLLKDVLVIVTLFLISAVLPPSLVTLATRYLKLSTSSATLFPNVRLTLLLLLTFSTFFLAFTLIPAFTELSSSCAVLDWIWFIVDYRRAMSSAKSRSLSKVVKIQRIPILFFLTGCCSTQSIMMRNQEPDMQQPCFTAVIKGKRDCDLVVLNHRALEIIIKCFFKNECRF